MTKAELFAKVDSTWLSTKRKQELKTAVEEYTTALIAAKPLVSGRSEQLPLAGIYDMLMDAHEQLAKSGLSMDEYNTISSDLCEAKLKLYKLI